jgi:hypothetical protein
MGNKRGKQSSTLFNCVCTVLSAVLSVVGEARRDHPCSERRSVSTAFAAAVQPDQHRDHPCSKRRSVSPAFAAAVQPDQHRDHPRAKRLSNTAAVAATVKSVQSNQHCSISLSHYAPTGRPSHHTAHVRSHCDSIDYSRSQRPALQRSH